MNRLMRAAAFPLILFFSSAMFAQEAAQPDFNIPESYETGTGVPLQAVAQQPTERVLLASTTLAYPVTPGDIYSLSFLRGTSISTQALVVENDFRVNMGVFGIQDSKGLTYQEFKGKVEALVAKSYPNSSPQVTLRSTGVFLVALRGEVKTSALVPAWGLTRLSSVFDANKTRYASERKVRIAASDGTVRTYDLFRARRDGDLNQDPLLRPGDVVSMVKADRRVALEGEVYRPGLYELLPGENLQVLLERYGEGFTELADRERVGIRRRLAEGQTAGEAEYLDLRGEDLGKLELRDLDVLTVYSRQSSLPAIFFEGAITLGERTNNPNESSRLRYVFYPGERLSLAVRNIREKLTPVSDLTQAYLRRARDGSITPVNLEEYLHKLEYTTDPVLEANDVVIIPFRRYFVTVSGAVYRPGSYPFVPDKTWEYYVGLAGGVRSDLNNGKGQTVYAADGRKRSSDLPIQPEDNILVPSNSFLYNFTRVVPVITTAVAVIDIVITVLTYQRN